MRRKALLIAPMAVGALMAAAIPAPGAPAVAGPVTTSEIITAGLAFGDFTYPVQEGKQVRIRRHVLDVGEVVQWKNQPSSTIALFQSGRLTNYPNCSSKQGWRAFPAYYVVRSAADKTLSGVTVNDGDEQVELITISSEAVGAPQRDDQLHRHSGGAVVDPVVPAKGCPSGPAAESTDLAKGVATESAGVDLTDHNQIGVYRHVLPAGHEGGWNFHPDPAVVIQTRGSTTVWSDCDSSVTQKPGNAYVQQAAAAPQLITNPGSAEAEYLEVVLNIPRNYPIDFPPIIPSLPPAGCLERL